MFLKNTLIMSYLWRSTRKPGTCSALLLPRSGGSLTQLPAPCTGLIPTKPSQPPPKVTDRVSTPLRTSARRCFPSDPQYNSSACSCQLTDESSVG